MKITRAYNLKVSDEKLISELNKLHDLFKKELQSILSNENIQLNSFTQQEYSNKFKGEFYSKLAELTNKNYLNWGQFQKAKYFRMLANEVRKNFKLIYRKNQIAQICKTYNFDYMKYKDKIREDLTNKNIFPTFAEIKNICRSQIVPDKHEDFKIKLDFASSQDFQTIKQDNQLKPIYSFGFGKDNWIEYVASIPNYLNYKKITKFCKPAFFKNQKDNDNWWITIPYEQSIDSVKQNEFIGGIDIGIVKPFSLRIINYKTKEVVSRNLEASKETINLNNKLRRLEFNRNSIYKKISAYESILKNKKDLDIINKKIRIELELYYLRIKISKLKVRLGRLMSRDINYFAKKYNISKIKLERLNFVENTGGKWDFSQQQNFIEQGLENIGVRHSKVNAAKSSSQNPFTKNKIYGRKSNREIIFDNFRIDRDDLGGINIGSRPDKAEEYRLILNFTKIIYSNREIAKISR